MAQTSRSQKNAQRQQSANVAGELHSRVVPRQSILPVTEKTSDGTRRTPGIRRVSAVSPPPRKKNSSESFSRSRSRSFQKSAPANSRHRRIASTDCTRAKCPSALSSSLSRILVRSARIPRSRTGRQNSIPAKRFFPMCPAPPVSTRTSCDCLAAASPGLPAGCLLRPHSPSTAVESRG